MKKFNKGIAALCMATTMVTGITGAAIMNAAPVMAFTYPTTINGTKTTVLTKYLIVDNDAEIPNQELTFTVTAGGTTTEATTSLITLYQGINPTDVKVNTQTGGVGTVTFTPSSATTAGTANDGIANSTDKKYAQETITLDFSSVTFTQPGVYRYIVTESGWTGAVGVKNGTSEITTVDVYVDDNNGVLEISGYVAYEGTYTDQPASSASDVSDAKDDKFINELTTYEIDYKKTVTGNQGDKTDKFSFTYTFTGLGNGTKLNVTYSDPTATATVGEAGTGTVATGTTAGTEIWTADASGNLTVTVSGIDHDENTQITGIPAGAKYTVTEVGATLNSTDSKYYTSDGYEVSGQVTTATTINNDILDGVIENKREGVIPTGVIVAASTGVAIVAVAVVGLVIARKKRATEEE